MDSGSPGSNAGDRWLDLRKELLQTLLVAELDQAGLVRTGPRGAGAPSCGPRPVPRSRPEWAGPAPGDSSSVEALRVGASSPPKHSPSTFWVHPLYPSRMEGS